MKIETLLKDEVQGYRACGGTIKRYSAVNIGYVDVHKQAHETQLNVSARLDTEKGAKELIDLFASLCKEFETTADSVTYVRIAATDSSEAALIERGF